MAETEKNYLVAGHCVQGRLEAHKGKEKDGKINEKRQMLNKSLSSGKKIRVIPD
ncbi:hypothetical protein OF158_01025 [Weizmannia sp. WK01]|uniref:hypothetical protein n=1 Tax=Weizmannia sp. WK01 TaxID=2984845 RepID=UPI0021F80865|nr:hypothetical protein [Weizmannia sp. WK01]UYT05031.1 hypothetical protein OF158_01025 [Weizmannia sp. WK01]